ncbi:unnamed protein product, partial [Polarella glacialis]
APAVKEEEEVPAVKGEDASDMQEMHKADAELEAAEIANPYVIVEENLENFKKLCNCEVPDSYIKGSKSFTMYDDDTGSSIGVLLATSQFYVPKAKHVAAKKKEKKVA